MKRLLVALLFGAMLITTGASAVEEVVENEGQSNNNPGALKAPDKTAEFPSCWYQSKLFYGPGQVFTFNVAKTEDTAAGILRLRTADGGIAGDLWQAEITSEKPRFKTDIGVGSTGALDVFEGTANVAPMNEGVVAISYSEGIDQWPAIMYIEFCYSREREDGMPELTIMEVIE